jgi:hypothetical protein
MITNYTEELGKCKLLNSFIWPDWFRTVPLLGVSWGEEAQVGVASWDWEIFRNPDELPSHFRAWEYCQLALYLTVPCQPQRPPTRSHKSLRGCTWHSCNLSWNRRLRVTTRGRSLPVFSGGSTRLEFTQSGSNMLIWWFSQKLGLLVHLTYALRTVARALVYAGGIFSYSSKEPVSVLASPESCLEAMQSPSLFQDLWTKQCRCPNMIGFSFHQRIGLRVPGLALLAVDSPTAPRCFPS